MGHESIKHPSNPVELIGLLRRIEALEKNQPSTTIPRILEEMIDRACAKGLPVGLSCFSDYVRSLYPEHYKVRRG